MEKLFNLFRRHISAQIILFKTSWHVSRLMTILSFVFEIIANFFPLYLAFVERRLIDGITFEADNRLDLTQSLFLIVLLYAILLFFSKILISAKEIIKGEYSALIQRKLNVQLMNKLATLECEFFDTPDNQNLINQIHLYKTDIGNSFNYGTSIIVSLASLVTGLALFLPFQPILGFFYIITFLPSSIMNYKAKTSMEKHSIDSIPDARRKNYYRSILTQSNFAKDLRLYGMADYFSTQFNLSWKKIRKERQVIFKKGSWKVFLSGLVSVIGLISLLFWAVISASAGDLSIGSLSLILNLSGTVGASFFYLSLMLPLFSLFMVPRILSFEQFSSQMPKQSQQAEEKMPIDHISSIEFRNVSFKYPGQTSFAVSNLSFEICSGEKWAVVGHNGSGKTTLVKLILGYYTPQQGSILVNGLSLKTVDLDSYRKAFSVCFQSTTKYSFSLRENIAISNVEETAQTEKAHAAAYFSGINYVYSDRKEGIDLPLTRNFSNIGYEPSVGEWQRIGISRAYFRVAPFVIMDEPSASLDPESEDALYHNLSKLLAERTGIIITHRLSMVSLAENIIVLDKGQLIEVGNIYQLMENKGHFYRLFQTQASLFLRELNDNR